MHRPCARATVSALGALSGCDELSGASRKDTMMIGPMQERIARFGRLGREAERTDSERGATISCLLATPYCTITWTRNPSIMRFVRSDTPFPSIQRLEQERIDVEEVLYKWGRSRLLVDLRAAAPCVDPAFEAPLARLRRGVLQGGERTAILVRTAVGALQVKRHMREDGLHAGVFHDEEEALAYLEARSARSSQMTASSADRAAARRNVLRAWA